MKWRQKRIAWFGVCSLAVFLTIITAPAGAQERQSQGQTVYVPVYSHIFYGNLDKRSSAPPKLLLSSMLSIRNVDPDRSIAVKAVRYHDTDGKLLREDNAPRTLLPLASADVFVEFKDDAGGAGAKFIVVWESESPVHPPIIESVNTHYIGTQLTSFTSRGQAIK